MSVPPARAFWLREPGAGEIRAEPLPPPGEDEALVRTRFSGISRGTETLVFRGEVPPAEHQRMRAPFQSGDFPAPVKYGYSSVGVVEQGPPDLVGREVFCLYPHQDRYVVPAGALQPLPDGVPAGRAVLAANLETAVNALWDAPPRVGDRVAVVGAGTVGCAVAWLAGRIPGTRVELVDTDPARAAVAEALGARFAHPDAVSAGCDLVVHASASAEGLATALAAAGPEATVLELSWYGSRAPAIPLGANFHAGRLLLRSSQVGSVAPAQRPRWTHAARLRLALSLLRDPVLDVLVSGEDRFDDLPAVMAGLAAAGAGALCHRLRYD